jgi:hypothetical protein
VPDRAAKKTEVTLLGREAIPIPIKAVVGRPK